MLGHARLYPSTYHSRSFQFTDSKHMHAHHDFGQHSHHVAVSEGSFASSTSAASDIKDDINFHDYIHAKHDDEKDVDYTRHTLDSSMPDHPSADGSNIMNDLQTNAGVHSRNGDDSTVGSNNAHQSSPTPQGTDTHLSQSDMGHLYGSTSHHYAPFDHVPPPTQDLFRTLMEELQAQAAIQRDQFLASSTKHDSSSTETDYSFGGHQTRTLPKFMMEPLDFLSANYESCLEPGSDTNTGSVTAMVNHSFQQAFEAMSQSQVSSSLAATSSIPPHSCPAPSISEMHKGSVNAGISNESNPRKRSISDNDDSHMYSNNGGTTTPPPNSSNHEHQSPPTQDLFRMLMEELETQAAIQRDQFLASTMRSDGPEAGMNSTEFSFSGNSHSSQHLHQSQHHHARLPRFVMEPFDFLSQDYGDMQVDGTANQSVEATHDVFMGQASSSGSQDVTATSAESATEQLTTPPLLPSGDGHLSPPTQNLFRTLMEELETQAAFQRDQVLAKTTGTAPRVDPDEYVFNGQHLRPLPRFMFEPMDFLSAGYESCLDGGMTGQHSLIAGDTLRLMTSTSSSTSEKVLRPSSSSSRVPKRPPRTSNYKTILPHRPKLLTILPSENATADHPQSANPVKKRRLDGGGDVISTRAPTSPIPNTMTSPLGPERQDSQGSPISSTAMSGVSNTNYTNTTSTANSFDGTSEGAAASTKRPWTLKEEALLLKLFSKRTPIKEIAQTLDRTVHSVRSRRQILTDPGFVKGKGHGVSRRSKQDSATTTKLPTYAQMAFLSLAWLPDMEGTLNDVAAMVEKLFSRHLNRIPRTGHKNLQIWRAQISDALAHEKGQPRPRFESLGVKQGRQWVYRLTRFGKGMVKAMDGVEAICQDLLKSNEAGMATSHGGDLNSDTGAARRDGDEHLSCGSGADAGIGQGQGYGYSYRPPDVRQKTGRRSRASRKAAAKVKEQADSGNTPETPTERAANAIANAMDAMAGAMTKMMALEDERAAASGVSPRST